MYTIKEISEMMGLKASTIRYYEEIGLLENVVHKDKYHRLYDQKHVDRLGAIECFKKARLSLEDIKQFFEYEKNMESCSGMIIDMMTQQEEKTLEAMRTLEEGLNHVRKKIKYYSIVDNAVKTGERIPTWNEIFEK